MCRKRSLFRVRCAGAALHTPYCRKPPSERPISLVVSKRVSNSKDIRSEPITQETSEPMPQEKEAKILTHVESNENEKGDDIRSSQFTSSVNEDLTLHELKQLMERPTLVASGTVAGSSDSLVFQYDRANFEAFQSDPSSIPGYITAIRYPQDIVEKNPVVASKIRQFCYFKADMKLDVKINKGPEISGCLLAVYIPSLDNLEFDLSNITAQGMTSYPYEILDYSTDTSLTMTVPYINQFDYFNFQQGTGSTNLGDNFGVIVLFNLVSPLSGTGSANVSISTFASFENMELKLPVEDAPPTFRAQSGLVERIPGSDIMSDSDVQCTVKLNYNTQEIDNSKILYGSNETSLQHVLRRENIIGKLSYSTGTNADNSSFFGKVRCFPKRPPRKSMGPAGNAANYGNSPSLLPKAVQMGTFDYVSNLFARWTGTVEIGIRLIKTKFHYGRIAVVFDPFDRITEEDQLGSLLSTNYAMIIDLNAEDGEEGSSNYYRISVPYMNNVSHSTIGNDFGTIGDFANGVKACMVGNGSSPFAIKQGMREVYNPYLRFYALTELGRLEVAADSVPILISISAGADYELSIPTVNVAVAEPPTVADTTFYCQSGLELIPDSTAKSSVNLHTSVGEKITDLRQLTHRYTPVNVNVFKSPAYQAYGSSTEDSNGYIDPQPLERSVTPGGVTLSLSRNTIDGHRLSNVEAVGLLYRFLYGGRKYKCTTSERGSTMMARLIHVPGFSGDIPTLTDDVNTILTEEFEDSQLVSDTGVDVRFLRHGYAAAPAVGVARAINGQMVVNTSVNNFMEVSRSFYSNRKLVSTRMIAGRRQGYTDDVVIQIVSFSPNSVRTLQFPEETLYASVGPHISADGTRWEKMAHRDPSNHETWNNDLDNTLISPADLQTDDALYYVGGSGRSLKCAEINNASVLEAMSSDGGFTFLQAPPCVVFL